MRYCIAWFFVILRQRAPQVTVANARFFVKIGVKGNIIDGINV